LQEFWHNSRLNLGVAVDEIRRRRYVLSPQGLYGINTKCCMLSSRRIYARWRVMRYKGGKPPLMIYAALRASMICQACGLDKKIKQPDWVA